MKIRINPRATPENVSGNERRVAVDSPAKPAHQELEIELGAALPNVSVVSFDGLVIECAAAQGAQVMVRGLKKVDKLFVLTMTAYNLTRMRTLGAVRLQGA